MSRPGARRGKKSIEKGKVGGGLGGWGGIGLSLLPCLFAFFYYCLILFGLFVFICFVVLLYFLKGGGGGGVFLFSFCWKLSFVSSSSLRRETTAMPATDKAVATVQSCHLLLFAYKRVSEQQAGTIEHL